jgi:hypothetical protein
VDTPDDVDTEELLEDRELLEPREVDPALEDEVEELATAVLMLPVVLAREPELEAPPEL